MAEGRNREGQAVCCDTTRLAREALRPPVASLQSRGCLAAPCTLRRGTIRPLDPGQPFADWMRGQAFAPDTTTRHPARFLRPCPTLRGLDARQRPVPLHRQPGEPCSPDTPSVRLSRPTPRRKAFRLSTPDQPCAGWMRGNRIAWCNGIRDLAALMRPSSQPPPVRGKSEPVCRRRAYHQRRSPL